MPSLRRTISSPSVRSSPYPSLSSAVNGGPGSRGNGHRRSSGSETSGRRVLADIEWWRVADGQRDIEADQETEEHNRDQTFDNILGQGLVAEDLLGSTVHFNTVLGAEHPSMVSMSAAEGLLQVLPPQQLFRTLKYSSIFLMLVLGNATNKPICCFSNYPPHAPSSASHSRVIHVIIKLDARGC